MTDSGRKGQKRSKLGSLDAWKGDKWSRQWGRLMFAGKFALEKQWKWVNEFSNWRNLLKELMLNFSTPIGNPPFRRGMRISIQPLIDHMEWTMWTTKFRKPRKFPYFPNRLSFCDDTYNPLLVYQLNPRRI